MKLDDLTKIAKEDPSGRASTARFRLAGRTLWFKDDKKMYHPIVSHCHNFVVDWGNPYHGGLHACMPSRTYNDCERIYSNVMWRWVTELGGVEYDELGNKKSAEESDTTCCPFPAVRVQMKFPSRKKFSVRKPSAIATKLLTLGKHPENGTTRLDWCCNTSRGRFDDELPTKWLAADNGLPNVYKNSFIAPFEEVITSLAYGAVRREQSLGAMTMALGQLKGAFDTSALNMVEEITKQAETYFTPPTSLAGHAMTPLEDLISKMGNFNNLAYKLHAASEIFKNLAAAPDSICARVSTPVDDYWDCNYLDTVGDIEEVGTYNRWSDSDNARGVSCRLNRSNNNKFTVESKVPDTMKEELANWEPTQTQWLESVNTSIAFYYKPLLLTDHNIRSFSYYWVRRNKEHYENILGQIGCNLPKLFGQYPDEWQYEQMAAALFLRDQS